MKKIYYGMALLLSALTGSCQDEELLPKQSEEIRVTASLTGTRTSFVENGNVTHTHWNKGDMIGLSTTDNRWTYQAQTEGKQTTFCSQNTDQHLKAAEGDTVYAFYPGHLQTDPHHPLQVILPQNVNQTYGESPTKHDVLLASATVRNNQLALPFKHQHAFLRITFPTRLVPVRGKGCGLYIQSTENISRYTSVYDLQKKKFIANSDSTNQESNSLIYNIPDSIKKEQLTCYIAILPQSQQAEIKISRLENQYVKERILTRKAPQGGFKAGHIYTISLTESEVEAEERMRREALIAFYQATDGPNWNNHTNWGSDKPLSEWFGVTYINQQVVAIELNQNNLKGDATEALTALAPLKGLISLSLAENNLTGRLPSTLGEMPSLQGVQLNDNQLTGSIPTSYAQLMKENSFLSLQNNQLSDILPAEISGHSRFHIYWRNLLLQKKGFGFSQVDIPAHPNTVKCYNGHLLPLNETYAKNTYTLLFVWDPQNATSTQEMGLVMKLYNKYKAKGLGLLASTLEKYDTIQSNANLNTFFQQMEGVPQFWQSGSISPHDEYDNNPYVKNNGNRYLFGTNACPSFYVINQKGHIVYFNTRTNYSGVVPQYHSSWSDVYDFVAKLFGDTSFTPDLYTSSDYSRDGESFVLQKATQGKGIDLIFMGEAFTDKDIASGKYKEVMQKGMEQFFAYEPYKTFRHRFNVYGVYVVSPNAEFTANARHRINTSPQTCMEYANQVTERETSQPQRVSVIYNEGGKGRSYTAMMTDGSFIAFMMKGVNNVLTHEAGGHGFGKLLDEYVERGNEQVTLPESNRQELEQYWTLYGWGANVDWRNDRNTVKWKHFLQDPRYANEGLDILEGANLYGLGAYRSTANSMMNLNDAPFNAPSREQIYKFIMQASEGSEWKYNYEDFVSYDAINRTPVKTRGKISAHDTVQWEQRKEEHRPPVFIQGTWREVLNGQRP